MLRELIRRSFSVFTAFIFVFALEKWAVDGCLGEYGYTIFPKWASVPDAVCKWVSDWDRSVEFEDARKASGQGTFYDSQTSGIKPSFFDQFAVPTFMLARPTQTMKQFPGKNRVTSQLFAEAGVFSIFIAFLLFSFRDLFGSNARSTLPSEPENTRGKYQIREDRQRESRDFVDPKSAIRFRRRDDEGKR